ncbi:hypothetical protein, partial [Propylenella binzhouense]
MNARQTWNLRKDRPSTESRTDWGREADQLKGSAYAARLDSIARAGETRAPENSARERVSQRLESGLRGFSAADLERAVERLARDIEQIEQAPARTARPESLQEDIARAPGRSGMSSTLERLEARLDALGERLERRAVRPEPRQVAPEPDRESLRSIEGLADRIDRIQEMLTARQPDQFGEEIEDLGRTLEAVARDGRGMSEGLAEMRDRIAGLEEALRAGRIGAEAAPEAAADLKHRLDQLSARISALAETVPARDTVEQGYAALIDRLDRMEAAAGERAPDGAIAERIDLVRQEVRSLPSHDQIAKLEEGLLDLADRLDNMVDRIDRKPFGRLESQIEQIATQLADLRKSRAGGTVEIQASLDAIARRMDAMQERLATDQFARLEERFAELAGSARQDFAATSRTTLDRLERQLAALGSVIEQHERSNSERLFADLDRRFEGLDRAIERMEAGGSAAGLENVERKLDLLQGLLGEQGRQLPPAQTDQIDRRLEQIQAKLANSRADERIGRQLEPVLQGIEEIARRLDQAMLPELGPLAERIEALDARIALLAERDRSAPESLKVDLDGITGRLEALAVQRPADAERFERVVAKLEEALAQDRLAERFDALEAKIESLGGALDRAGRSDSEDDMADLRSDIAALRRELRSMPVAGQGDDLGAVLRTLAEKVEEIGRRSPVTAGDLDRQVERILAMIDAAERGDRPELGALERQLRAIQERLERGGAPDLLGGVHELPPDRDAETVQALARNISADIGALRNSRELTDAADRESLEAVQETLEAVMKRMAFLERDAKAATAEPRAPAGRIAPDVPVRPEAAAKPASASA